MHTAGHVFRRAGNGVWLVDAVPATFLDYPLPREAHDA
jgi:RNA:NAD 2'-phosphotransferase (TPT1/KptA family)